MAWKSELVALLICCLAPALAAQTKPPDAEVELARKLSMPGDNTRLDKDRITPGLVQALRDLGNAAKAPAEQQRILSKDVDLARTGGLTEMQADATSDLGVSFRAANNYAESLQQYTVALDLYRQAGSSPVKVAYALDKRAIARQHLGDPTGALEDSRQALDLARKAGEEVLSARILNAMGNSYVDLGDFRRALDVFQQSLHIAERRGEKLGQSFVLLNIGSVYFQLSDFETAGQYTRRSLEIKESLGKRAEMVSSLINLGDVYDHLGRDAESGATLQKALRLARETGQKGRIAQALRVIGRREVAHGRVSRGLPLLEQSRDLFAEVGERLNVSAVYFEIATAYFVLHDYPAAKAAALRAQELAREGSGTLERTLASLILGQVLRAAGDRAGAREALTDSVASVEEMRDTVVGESERATYFAGRTDRYTELLILEMDEGHPEAAFQWAEQAKARVLLELLHAVHPASDRSLTEEERAKEKALQVRLASLRAQRDGASSQSAAREGSARIEKAREDLQAFHAALYAAHPELRAARGDVQPISIAQAARLMPDPSTALIEYAITDSHAYVFVITRGRAGPQLYTHTIPVSSKTLKAAAVRFREHIASRDPGFAAEAQQLYSWLLGPARRELAGKTSLIVVPDGELWHMPFQALQDSSGRFLIQQASLAFAPSLSVLNALAEARPTAGGPARTLLALGDPSENAPESAHEVDAVAALYGAPNSSVWKGPAATRDVFYAKAGAFDVLHLAAHGVFDDRNPMGSHLILAAAPTASPEEGWLEARDVRNLNLKANLVVLSGCETARGRFLDGEGSIGLSWAFLAAGSRAALASQWRVESASTASLMVAFHSGWRQGLSKAEALRLAALKLLATEHFHHPFYWAAFVLLGAGGPG